MTKIASFTKIENEVLPKFRDSMAQARSTEDVRKFFVYSVLELLNGALAGAAELTYEDIRLAPGETPGYVLSPNLADHPALTALIGTSDLTAILGRFAAAAGNHYKRLEKNPEKTEAKMYHGTGGPGRA